MYYISLFFENVGSLLWRKMLGISRIYQNFGTQMIFTIKWGLQYEDGSQLFSVFSENKMTIRVN